VEQIFVAVDHTQTDIRGGSDRILFRDRYLDGCSSARTFSTVHIEKGPFGSGYQVELGFTIQRILGDTYPYVYQAKQIGGSEDYTFLPSLYLEYGTKDEYKISGHMQDGGQTKWDLTVDFLDGVHSWDNYDQYYTSWDQGYDTGESERIGEYTGMRDDHTYLFYKNVGTGFQPWPDMYCIKHRHDNTAKEWKWNDTSANDYEVIQGSDNC
jgi:hypothetical protein